MGPNLRHHRRRPVLHSNQGSLPEVQPPLRAMNIAEASTEAVHHRNKVPRVRRTQQASNTEVDFLFRIDNVYRCLVELVAP